MNLLFLHQFQTISGHVHQSVFFFFVKFQLELGLSFDNQFFAVKKARKAPSLSGKWESSVIILSPQIKSSTLKGHILFFFLGCTRWYGFFFPFKKWCKHSGAFAGPNQRSVRASKSNRASLGWKPPAAAAVMQILQFSESKWNALWVTLLSCTQ